MIAWACTGCISQLQHWGLCDGAFVFILSVGRQKEPEMTRDLSIIPLPVKAVVWRAARDAPEDTPEDSAAYFDAPAPAVVKPAPALSPLAAMYAYFDAA